MHVAYIGLGRGLMSLTATYAVVVRTSEYDMPPELLDDLVAQTVSRATDHSNYGEEPRRKRARETDYDMDDD